MARGITLVDVGGHGESQPRVDEPFEKFVARTEGSGAGTKRESLPVPPDPPPPSPTPSSPPSPKRARSDPIPVPKPIFAMNDSHAMLLAVLLGLTILVSVVVTQGSFF